MGRTILVRREGEFWQAYAQGADGKRAPAGFVIPEFVEQSKLEQYLFDLFHESGTPVGWRREEDLLKSRIRYWLGSAGSASLLAGATYAWADLFVFSKSSPLPPLAFVLPFPLLFPSYIAVLCLVPAAALPAGLRASATAVAGAIALGSLGAVTAYWAQWANGSYLIANALFAYAYIALRFCLPAGILLLMLRALPVIAGHVRRRPRG